VGQGGLTLTTRTKEFGQVFSIGLISGTIIGVGVVVIVAVGLMMGRKH
jgi:hypothetical protein